MSVSIKDVEYVSGLARLEFNEDEKENLIEELNSVLTYMEKLNELNTDNVDIIVNPYYIENKFREDEIEASLETEDIFSNSPKTLDNYIVVPKIIE